MKNWQNGNGEGSSERTVAILAVVVIIAVIVWRLWVVF